MMDIDINKIIMQVSNNKEIVRVIKAMKDYVSSMKKKGTKLFSDDSEDESQKLHMVISLFKIPPLASNGLATPSRIDVLLPHRVHHPTARVLLIIKAIKDDSISHEMVSKRFKDILMRNNADDLIHVVMTECQIKEDYVDYETKRALASQFDVVLCERSVVCSLPKILGKSFLDNGKAPIPIKFNPKKKGNYPKNIRSSIQSALRKSRLYMTMTGNSGTIVVGRSDQSNAQVAENICCAVQRLFMSVPGGGVNIQSLHIKMTNTISLPIYISKGQKDDVPPLKGKKPVRPSYVGEVDTLPEGHVVILKPDATMVIAEKGSLEYVKAKMEMDEAEERAKKEKKIAVALKSQNMMKKSLKEKKGSISINPLQRKQVKRLKPHTHKKNKQKKTISFERNLKV